MISLLSIAGNNRVTETLPDNLVIVLFSILQSNSNGRAEADRLVITTWPLRPINSFYLRKTDYTATNNGTIRGMAIGGDGFEEPDESARRMFAADAIMVSKLRSLFGGDTPIYTCNAAEGGTFTVTKTSSRDWQEASNECFARATTGMYSGLITSLEALYPTREIKVIVMFHGGESEAISGGSDLTNFPSALQSLYNSMNGVDSYLAEAPWLFTKIYYNVNANEATINGHIQTFVDANPDRCYVVDISDQPRKQDLTTEQKAGVSPSGTDDQHTSYLGQIAKAERHYPNILDYFNWPNRDISEITDNTVFDPSVYAQPGKAWFRLQLNRDNMTILGSGGTAGDENKITDILDNGDISRDWTVAGTAPRFKIHERIGCLHSPPGASVGATRIISPVSLSNQIFNDGGFVWSLWFIMKRNPNTGSGGNPIQCILSSTDVYSGTRSNVLLYIVASGDLQLETRCNSSTVKIAQSDQPFCNVTVNEADQDWIFGGVTSNGSNVKLFRGTRYTAVEEIALDATNNGSLSGITPANFNNSVNGIVGLQRQTGASTFDMGYMGDICEVGGMSSIALTAEQFENIKSNVIETLI